MTALASPSMMDTPEIYDIMYKDQPDTDKRKKNIMLPPKFLKQIVNKNLSWFF